MSNQLKVDNLNAVAKELATGAEGFAGMMPALTPDAGPSTAAIDDLLGSIAKAMSTVTHSAASAADAAQTALAGYQKTDGDNGVALRGETR